MEEFRNKICLIEGKYMAKCVDQDYILEILTFEISPDGPKFTKRADGVTVVEDAENIGLSFEEVKHLLPTVKEYE